MHQPRKPTRGGACTRGRRQWGARSNAAPFSRAEAAFGWGPSWRSYTCSCACSRSDWRARTCSRSVCTGPGILVCCGATGVVRGGRAEAVPQEEREEAADIMAEDAAGARALDEELVNMMHIPPERHSQAIGGSCECSQDHSGERVPGFLDKKVPLHEHKTLGYMATFLAYGWQASRESGNTEMEAFCGRGLMAIEQMILDNGRLQIGWLMTGMPEPVFPGTVAARRGAALRPFSKLCKPAWAASCLAYVKDLDYMESRLKAARETPKFSSPARPKAKWRPKKPKKRHDEDCWPEVGCPNFGIRSRDHPVRGAARRTRDAADFSSGRVVGVGPGLQS
eukprot:s425_g7.t1